MKNRTLFWQFFGTHILILFAAVGVVAFYTWFTGREVFHRQWVRELETQTKLAAALLPHAMGRSTRWRSAGFSSGWGIWTITGLR